jgi:hypothetical protein
VHPLGYGVVAFLPLVPAIEVDARTGIGLDHIAPLDHRPVLPPAHDPLEDFGVAEPAPVGLASG